MNSSFNLCKMKKITIVFAVIFAQMFFGQEKKEVLKIDWPKEYEWKVVVDEKDGETDVIQMIPKKENENNWSILVSIMSSKSFITISEDFIKGLFESESPTKDPLAKLTILEKSNEKENVWIIFKTEASFSTDSNSPLSQICYLLQSKNTLNSICIMEKEKSLSEEFVKKWSKVFKEGRLVNE